ncbi:PREDICTED: disintegrin and metalloproteinase domain-containing protein 2-like, partial [Merops nubicus]|uniref:disintegrin and metalloproteinase domain-containing protein 2-like n=1 Tax=Merops nubicus TaxID=57421 RepID=UPI0004F0841F
MSDFTLNTSTKATGTENIQLFLELSRSCGFASCSSGAVGLDVEQPADTMSYVLRIEGKPYTVHLQQHVFLSDDFRIYLSDERGSLHSVSTLTKGGCQYRGYVEGFPSSAVTLSTCSGLRGLLQLENISYGIEPLGYSPDFEHFAYRLSGENTTGSLLDSSRPQRGPGGLREPLSAAAQSPKYFRVHVVLDKALYNYMGSDTNAAMQKIVQVFGLVNNMFSPLNVTIVLSSLELWTEENKILTAGEADDLLQRFLQWKQPHLAPHSYDAAYLLVYRDRAAAVGATAPGRACQRDAAGAVAVYQGATTLESFSVLLAQLLGRSLGMSYGDSGDCRCPGHSCLMSLAARRPRLSGLSSRAALCGNGVVEPGEQCDCGTARACLKDKCCTETCQFKPGVKCSSGLCCSECQ